MPIVPFVPAIIGAGASVGGAALAAHGATKAADTQAQASDRALALQKELYEQQRSDLAPYRQLGYGALGTLAGLVGQPAPSNPMTASPPVKTGVPAAMESFANNPPAAITPGNGLGAIQRFNQFPGPFAQQVSQAAAAGNGLPAVVTMRTPDGRVVQIPAARVNEAIARGAQKVG